MTTAGFPPEQRLAREQRLLSAFTPHAPISDRRLFAGRQEQVREAADAIGTPGLHVVIFGERGVGKTSLANIMREVLNLGVSITKVNCGQSDTFAAVMRRAFSAFKFPTLRRHIGFNAQTEEDFKELVDMLPAEEQLAPDFVAELVAQLPPHVVFIVDEFDRLPSDAANDFADLMKGLSDRSAIATILIVGVARDIDTLISKHQSIERCLRQIPMQRMSDDELGEILDRGFAEAEFGVDGDAPRARIIGVSQGFPHYTHLLAQNAARQALDGGRDIVTERDVIAGMMTAVKRADQSHRELYHSAVTGTKKQNLWHQVVAACALADSDERGYFPTRSVQDQLSRILERSVKQQTVAFHLGKLTEHSRGPLLERTGPERRYRYRFLNPLMRPFVLMAATAEGIISPNGSSSGALPAR